MQLDPPIQGTPHKTQPHLSLPKLNQKSQTSPFRDSNRITAALFLRPFTSFLSLFPRHIYPSRGLLPVSLVSLSCYPPSTLFSSLSSPHSTFLTPGKFMSWPPMKNYCSLRATTINAIFLPPLPSFLFLPLSNPAILLKAT